MERKRAPGGGRKPKGVFSGKTSAFSTRVTPELRKALDDESERTGHSVSQIVEHRLRESFERPRRMDRALGEPHIRALAYLIARVAKAIERDTAKKWHKDAFTGRALISALQTAIGELRPDSSKFPVPEQVEKRYQQLLRNGADPAAIEYMNEPIQFGLISGLNVISLLQGAFDPVADFEWHDQNSIESDEHLLSFVQQSLDIRRKP